MSEVKHYALFDEQLGGYKAKYVSHNKEELIGEAASRAFELSQGDEEPCPEGLSNQEIIDRYGYVIHEVTPNDYRIIERSEGVGLFTTVYGVAEGSRF